MSYENLNKRLMFLGGDKLGRINRQKLKSLRSALTNDYNSRKILTPKGEIWQGLINTNNLKPDYDKKYLSIEFDAGLESGDVFRVLDNPQLEDETTRWMIYLPDLVETAYLRTEIIRCRYTIDIDGETYWVYFQGPTATDIDWQQRQSVDSTMPNWDGEVYIKNTQATKDYFHRFDKIKIAGKTWEVQVVDFISVPGIIELQLQESYHNELEELPEIIQQESSSDSAEDIPQPIIGKTLVKRNEVVGYSIIKDFYSPKDDVWGIEGNDRVTIDGIKSDGRICQVSIGSRATGSFTLYYGNHSMEVEIEEAYSEIIGNKEIMPYSIQEYEVNKIAGHFYVDSPLVSIIEDKSGYCKLQVLTGKKGEFILYYREDGSNEQHELPIKIKSL